MQYYYKKHNQKHNLSTQHYFEQYKHLLMQY